MRKNYHGLEIARLIDNHRVKRFAEVGVMRGRFAKRVLRQIGVTLHEYWGIDQWLELHSDKKAGRDHGHLGYPRRTQATWDEYYFGVCKLMTFFPCLHVLKAKSLEATDLFEDGYFDMVYIDTSHFYEDTLVEVPAWLPKVRPGGIISGHDYLTPTRKHAGVKKAIDELFPDGVNTLPDMVWWRHV